MRKTNFLLAALATVAFVSTGCLKDKGYEDQNYGIQVTEVKGVAFPRSDESPLALSINSQTTPLVVDGPWITLEAAGVAEADVTVTIDTSDAMVTAAGLTKFPAGSYSLNSFTQKIAAGQKYTDGIKINIPNSSLLNPNLKYGIGLKLKSVSAGYQIASNQKELVVAFSIKNKYDGVYRLQGYHNRVPYTYPYDTEVELVTVGPSSVIFYWPDAASNGHPIGIGPNNSMSWYGVAISPVIVFDPATNLVTNVYNNPPQTTVITMFTGAGSRLSKWDPATRAITVDWNYANNPLRAFFDDLTYLGER